MYTSRSAVESYQDCNHYRYLRYHLNGTGVVPVMKSVPLVTGGSVHRGIEHFLNRLRIGQEPDVDTGVGLAVEHYIKECEGRGFLSKTIQTDKQQWFTFNEQKALTEALVRAWYLVEMPNIIARYKVVAAEREVTPIQLSPNVWFMAKVDGEFQEITSGDYYNYSLKTTKQFTDRTEATYRGDLQGITETWAVEQEAKMLDGEIDNVTNILQLWQAAQRFPSKQIQQIREYIEKKKTNKLVSGVRFCFLIKGQRKRPDYFGNDPDALYITYNPLIRGYKNITPGGISYAHSWQFPNPENKTGKSILGKGWEPFNVWESDITLKSWIEFLFSGQCQPQCENPVKQHVYVPVEYFRNQAEIELAMKEVRYQEERIKVGLDIINGKAMFVTDQDEDALEMYFPHNRSICQWMKGEPCDYRDLCWKEEVKQDPIGSGLYEIRKPHHSTEVQG